MAEYAIQFDGSNDHIVIPEWVPSSNRWELRVKFELASLSLTYLLGHSGNSNNRLYVNPGSSPDVRIQGGGTSHRIDFDSGITWEVGRVYDLHAVMTFDGFNYGAELFIDSVSVAQITDGSGSFAFDWIGRRATASYGAFTLHELELKDTDTPASNRFYPVDEGSGLTIVDSLGGGSTDGALTNFAGDDSQWIYIAASNIITSTQAPQTATGTASFSPPDGSAKIISTQAPQTATGAASHAFPEGVTLFSFDDLALPPEWTEENGQFTATGGKLQATGSSPTGAKWVASFDAGASNGTLSATFNCGGDSAGFYGLACRYIDVNNFWLVCIYILSSSAAELRLYRRQSGSWTSVQSYAFPTFGRNDDYQVSVNLSGSTITAYLDGVEAFIHSSSFAETATRMGMRTSGTAPSLDNVRFVTAATEPLTIQDFVFRKSVNGNATLPVFGQLNVSTTAIEYSVNGGAWITGASPEVGPYSFDVTFPYGQHTVEVRLADNHAITATANFYSVVPVAAGLGQSNMSGRGDNPQTYERGDSGERHLLFTNADGYQELEDAWDSNVGQVDAASSDSNAGGSFMLRFAHHAMAATNQPLGFLPGPMGATGIEQWAKGGALRNSFDRRAAILGGVDYVFWHQGESNADTDIAVYEAALNQLVDDMWNDYGAITIIVALQTIHSDSDGNGITTGQAAVRQAQINVATNNPHAYITIPNTDIDVSVSGDGLHFKTDADLDTVGYRACQAYLEAIGANDTTPPVLVVNGGVLEINLTEGDTYTPPSFTATDDVDGDVSGSVVVSGDAVDTGTPGTYLVNYDVSDSAGNAADTVTLTVNVTASTVDLTPDPFTFQDVFGAALSSSYVSQPITVTGIDPAQIISISLLAGSDPSAEFSVNGGAWTNVGSSVQLDDTVRIRLTSSSSEATAVVANLDIGGVSDSWSVRTAAPNVAGGAAQRTVRQPIRLPIWR
ncbi:sialate O-acetylesterase [Hahella ganghwensis]|uniref:sialate O-acetylesterase n=1 Tax=Hahella ganghwensis TaxID=286420 RepID=UPI00035CCF4F|nr:sialate O-acetylesterase [Hahella ganghwensis]